MITESAELFVVTKREQGVLLDLTPAYDALSITLVPAAAIYSLSYENPPWSFTMKGDSRAMLADGLSAPS